MASKWEIPATKAKIVDALKALGITDAKTSETRTSLVTRFISAKDADAAAAANKPTRGKKKATPKKKAAAPKGGTTYSFLSEMDDEEFREVCAAVGLVVGPLTSSTRPVYEKKYLRQLDAMDTEGEQSSPSPARKKTATKVRSTRRRRTGGSGGIGSSSEDELDEGPAPAASPARKARASPARSPARKVAAKKSPARKVVAAARKRTPARNTGFASSGDELERPALARSESGVLSDADIRQQFKMLGVTCPIINPSTRKAVTRKLARMIEEQAAKGVGGGEAEEVTEEEDVDDEEEDVVGGFVEENTFAEEASQEELSQEDVNAARKARDENGDGGGAITKEAGSNMWMVVLALAVGVAAYLYTAQNDENNAAIYADEAAGGDVFEP